MENTTSQKHVLTETYWKPGDVRQHTGDLENAHKKIRRFLKAEACFRRALELNPNYIIAHNNLGNVLKETRRFSEAEACFRRALELEPGNIDAQLNLSLLFFRQGRYAEAWPYYEARYANITDIPFAQWRGEPLVGKSLLICPEQGLGDYIQFARYAALLKDRGLSRLTFLCPPSLKVLLQTIAGVDSIITDMASILPHDYWSFPLSLPLHFDTTVETIPATLPYVYPLSARIDLWRDRVPKEGLKVGLVWKGNPEHSNDANRSLPGLSTLAPLWSVHEVTFVSLQKGQGEDEARQSPVNQPIIPLGSDSEDLGDTAAIVAQLDLVISVDTSIAHLAGAMGKPCWVLLPAHDCDWRWPLDRSDSPWYPGVMRLFRQSNPDEWNETINEVAFALKAWVANTIS